MHLAQTPGATDAVPAARCYYTPRFLVCRSSLQSLQLPRFTSSKLYHSQVTPVDNRPGIQGYIQHNESHGSAGRVG